MGTFSPSAWSRWSWLCLAVLFGSVAVNSLTNPPAAYAQDDEPAAAADEPAGDAAAGPRKRSFLVWMIEASGPFGFMIFGLSFILVALLMMLGMQIRKQNFLPPDFLEQFEQKLNNNELQAAFELAKSNESFVGRVLAAGMGQLRRGYDSALQAMQETGDDETMATEHGLSYLALIGTVAPMLGLLGTVQGMIASFQVIAESVTSPKPSELAEGVATALFTTLEGLVVAVPAIVGFALLKNKLARFVFEASVVSEGMMARFQNVGKPAAPAPARPAAPAAQG